MGKIKALLILGLAVMSAIAAGCGGDDAADSTKTTATNASKGATFSTADPEKVKADRIARAKEAVKRGLEQDPGAPKQRRPKRDRNVKIPKPKKFNQNQAKPDSSGKDATSGFATFAIPAGWVERSAGKAGDIPKSDRLTQLVPADEAKTDAAGGSYTAVISVQKLSKAPSWAKSSEKGMIEYAMLYDGVDENESVSLSVDGSRAVGFGLTSRAPDVTSVYTVHNGTLFQINGGRTAPNGSPSAVQEGILTIVNTWSWN